MSARPSPRRCRFHLPARALALAGVALALQAGGVVTNSSLTSLYAALLGGGRVTFTPGADLNIVLAAPLQIQSDTILDASTTTRSVSLNGGSKVRIFNVNPGVTLTLLDIDLISGRSTNAGAIYSQGTVLATNCVFRDNQALGTVGVTGAAGSDDPNLGQDGKSGGAGEPAFGGAIYSLGDLVLRGCRLESNQATGGDGGTGGVGGGGALRAGDGGDGGLAGDGAGGAVYVTGSARFIECTFRANAAAGGDGGAGGAAGSGSAVSPSRAGESREAASALGGGLYALGPTTILACTFSTNTVTGGSAADETEGEGGFGREGRAGGAALGGAVFSAGTLSLVNSTFSNNAGTGGAGGDGGAATLFVGGRGGEGGDALGGALWNQGTAAATNCTFATGVATAGAGGAGGTHGSSITVEVRAGEDGTAGGGNVANASDATLILKNCLLADSPGGGNGFGELTDAGHNLSSDSSCHFDGPGSRNDTAASLGVLGDFGGLTPTIPLLANSPAIDAGESVPGLLTDQRGTTRPQGVAPDIGAFERPYSGLSGRVSRADGSSVVGVTITLLSVTSPAVTTQSGADGRFEFIQLPDVDLGVYRVLAPSAGTGFTPAFHDLQLSSASQLITNLDFVANGASIVSFGLTAEGTFWLRLMGEPGQTYRIEGTAGTAAWTTLGTGVAGAEGWLDFVDPAPATGAVRFYRGVSP